MRTAKEVAAAARKKSNPRNPNNGDPKLAENLVALREKHRLSCRAVGRETGLSNSYLWQVENCWSMPNVAILARLAAFYDVTLDDLAGHLVDAAKNGDA